MAITCVRLGAEKKFTPMDLQHLVRTTPSYTAEEDLPSRVSGEEVLRMGDYRDILSLTRILVYGPKSKADVDSVMERMIFFIIVRNLRSSLTVMMSNERTSWTWVLKL